MEYDVFKEMSEIIGVSGYENQVRELIKQHVKDIPQVTVSTDKIGNLICHMDGQSDNPSKVMIIGHMDEVGFQVLNVDDQGKAHVKTLGNIKTWNGLNQIVKTADGNKTGYISCDDPEGLKPHDYDKIYVVPINGIFEIGDVLGFETKLIETEKSFIGKALDNRISCYLMYQLLSSCIVPHNSIDFVFSVQEEIGMRGARVAITEKNPDIIIDLDTSPIGENNSLKIGNGVGIKLSDSIGVSSEYLVNMIETYSKENGIDYQREVSDCGTAELIITNEKDAGADRVGISIPCCNIHSTKTTIYKKDIIECQKLLKQIFTKGF